MANYFVYSGNGNDTNTGNTLDATWATIDHAVESGGITAGDIIWVHPSHSEIPTANVTTAYSGSLSSWIKLIGMPRPSLSITSSDWTHGNTAVTIDDNNMTENAHEGRYITAPDGRRYLITRVVSTSSIVIDREYIGTTVTNQGATIQADPDYGTFTAIDDSAWTNKISSWTSAAQTRPVINFNNTAYGFDISNDNWVFKNLIMQNSSRTAGVVDAGGNRGYIEGCLFKQASDARVMAIGSNYVYKRCIIKGSGGSDWNQSGVISFAIPYFVDCAIYGCGHYGIRAFTGISFNNLNIGVEQANGYYDIRFEDGYQSQGIDLKLDGTNGYISMSSYISNRLSIENYQKILNNHRTFYTGGFFESSLLTTSTTPAKKLSDYAIKITPNANFHTVNNTEFAHKIVEHRIWADTSSKTYRYWIYNNLSTIINDITSVDNLFLKITYISGYDDTSEYQYTTLYSTQMDIAQASSATDWDYLQISSIQPVVEGWITLEVYQSQYSESGTLYIDPQVEIS